MELLKYIVIFHTHNGIFKCNVFGKNDLLYNVLSINSKINNFNSNNNLKYT